MAERDAMSETGRGGVGLILEWRIRICGEGREQRAHGRRGGPVVGDGFDCRHVSRSILLGSRCECKIG